MREPETAAVITPQQRTVEKEGITMRKFWLTTKVDLERKSDDIIPAGSTGSVLDIMIDDGKALFLLEFEDTIEWFSPEDLEDCDHATTITDL